MSYFIEYTFYVPHFSSCHFFLEILSDSLRCIFLAYHAFLFVSPAGKQQSKSRGRKDEYQEREDSDARERERKSEKALVPEMHNHRIHKTKTLEKKQQQRG